MASRQLDLLASGAKSAKKHAGRRLRATKSRRRRTRRQARRPAAGRRRRAADAAGRRVAGRRGAAPLPELRRQRHHVARAARRARRPEAGAAPDPVRDVREPAPLPGRQAPQVRDDRRRRAGQVPPARRHLLLRRDGAHGAAVLDARACSSTGTATSARSTATRRPPTATPRRASRRWRWSCSTRSSRGRSTSARTTTARPRSRSSCRRKIPHLLVNGCTGIAVGMATNIPPHNLGEVCEAAVALIDDRKLETKDLLKYIKGPDFPTGGQITNSKKELREIYETGQGGVRVRGEWKTESGGKRRRARSSSRRSRTRSTKSTLVEQIAEVIISKKLPMLVDVRDESTDDVRIVLELKPGADPNLVMAYLYKHTPLETELPRQPDLPGPDGEQGDRRARCASTSRRCCASSSTSARRRSRRRFEFELAELRAAHPHPRRLRDDLRRARRGDPDHPQVATARPTPPGS